MGAVNTTYTFAANDTITSAKMNNIIDQTTMTDDAIFGTTLEIVSGQLKVRAQGITSNELAAGAVTSNVIADGTIVNADISPSAAIEPSKLGTGAIPVTATVTTGNVVDGSITAPKLSGAQTGNAPIYGARAWVRFNGNRNTSGVLDPSNTNRQILASGNVTSVLKNATGEYTVTFTTNLPSSNYVCVGQRAFEAGDSANITIQADGRVPQTSSTFRFIAFFDGGLANSADVQLVFFG